MKAINNKFSLIVIALLTNMIVTTNKIFKYCIVHSWSPQGPEGIETNYTNPYSNYVISLATVDSPEDFQQPDIQDFLTQKENFLYAQKMELDTDTSNPGTIEFVYNGDVTNKLLAKFCPNEKGNGYPVFNSPFVFWIEENFCDNDYNEILYPQKRFIAHFAFFKNWFSAYQKFLVLAPQTDKYYLVGWSEDGTIDGSKFVGSQQSALINFNDDYDVGSSICALS
jgi:hypothetical protein